MKEQTSVCSELLLPVSEVAATSQLLRSHLQDKPIAAHSHHACDARNVLPVSEVAATSAAVPRPNASHPAQRHLRLKIRLVELEPMALQHCI
jgi:hypothetical protein